MVSHICITGRKLIKLVFFPEKIQGTAAGPASASELCGLAHHREGSLPSLQAGPWVVCRVPFPSVSRYHPLLCEALASSLEALHFLSFPCFSCFLFFLRDCKCLIMVFERFRVGSGSHRTDSRLSVVKRYLFKSPGCRWTESQKETNGKGGGSRLFMCLGSAAGGVSPSPL